MTNQPSSNPWPDVGYIDLREYLEMLSRRRRTIVTCFVVAAVLALVGSLATRPVYRATTTLQIERDAPNILNFDSLLQVDATTDAFYQTQYRLIESRSLARRVVDNEGVVDNTELMGAGEGPGLISRAYGWVRALPRRTLAGVRRLAGTAPPDVSPDGLLDIETQDPRYAAAIGLVLGNLEVEPIRNTQLVQVSWSHTNPAVAATMTNAVARAYMDMNLEAKFETTEEASRFLAEEIERLQGEIADAQDKLQKYGRERDIISSDERQDTVTQALENLSAEYTRAQTDRVQKETYYQQLKTSDPSSLPEVFSNSLILGMKSSLAAKQQEYANLSRQFTDEFPSVQQVKAQISDLETRIEGEEKRIFDGLVRNANNNYQTALDRESRLSDLLEQQRTQAMNLVRNLTAYQALQVEIDNKKSLMESLLERQSETGVSARLQGLRTSSIRVIDRATVPQSPYRPRTTLNLIVGAAFGLFLGVGLALVQEHLDNTLKTADDVERRLGLANLSLVPSLHSLVNGHRRGYSYGFAEESYTEALKKQSAPELIAAEHPRSALAEAYRSLRTSVMLSTPGEPPKVLLITSAVPGEGKTTCASNLAISLAQVGKKVLLIDADLRRPRLHTVFKLHKDRALVHYLAGSEKELKNTVQRTKVENLWVMPCGPRPPNPAELLSSSRAGALFEAVRNAFDTVIVDSPPVMAVVDALVMVPWADGVVMVILGGETPGPLVDQACRRLQEVQGRVLGAVLNNVQVDQAGYFSYRQIGRDSRADSAED